LQRKQACIIIVIKVTTERDYNQVIRHSYHFVLDPNMRTRRIDDDPPFPFYILRPNHRSSYNNCKEHDTRDIASTFSSSIHNTQAVLHHPLLPPWTKIELSEEEEAKRTSRQDTLYWTGRRGPKFYLQLFQIQLIFISTYISLLVVKIYPRIILLPSPTATTMTMIILTSYKVLYIVLSLIPLILILSKCQKVAS